MISDKLKNEIERDMNFAIAQGKVLNMIFDSIVNHSKPKKADPNCKYCEGTGIAYFPNGPDDYYTEECNCVKQ